MPSKVPNWRTVLNLACRKKTNLIFNFEFICAACIGLSEGVRLCAVSTVSHLVGGLFPMSFACKDTVFVLL